MAEKRQSHLRVVRTPGVDGPARARTPEVSRADNSTVSYWTELQALRDERRRLRAG